MAWWTANQTLQVITGFWPVTLLWAILVTVAVGLSIRRGRFSYPAAAAAFLPFAFSAAIVLCGVVFNKSVGADNPNEGLAETLLSILGVAQLALSALLIWRFRGIRAFMTMVSLGALWLSFWGLFVSLMSVTGAWL